MNWQTYKLNLPDEATLDAVYSDGDEKAPPTYDPHTVAIVRLGTLYNDDAVMDGEEVITPATPMAGYHADLRLRIPLPRELTKYVVNPKNPRHKFDGDDQ